jgi:hypothetical protein
MSESVEFASTRLAAMWRELFTEYSETKARAYDNIPRTLNSTDLPAVVILPGALESRESIAGAPRLIKETRLYSMILHISLARLGDKDSGQIAAAPWFERVPLWFLARPGLELDANIPQIQNVFDAVLGLDNGYELLPYPTGTNQADLFGVINFPIRVTTQYRVTMRG